MVCAAIAYVQPPNRAKALASNQPSYNEPISILYDFN
jgi:hypothetical protein